MNKPKKPLEDLTKNIDEVFKLLSYIEENKLDSKNLEKLQKKSNILKKMIEKQYKNLDIKK